MAKTKEQQQRPFTTKHFANDNGVSDRARTTNDNLDGPGPDGRSLRGTDLGSSEEASIDPADESRLLLLDHVRRRRRHLFRIERGRIARRHDQRRGRGRGGCHRWEEDDGPVVRLQRVLRQRQVGHFGSFRESGGSNCGGGPLSTSGAENAERGVRLDPVTQYGQRRASMQVRDDAARKERGRRRRHVRVELVLHLHRVGLRTGSRSSDHRSRHHRAAAAGNANHRVCQQQQQRRLPAGPPSPFQKSLPNSSPIQGREQGPGLR